MREHAEMLIDLGKMSFTELYTVDELAPLLKVSRQTLRKYCVENVFQNAVKIGGKRWLIPGYDVLSLFPQMARKVS